MVERRRSSRKKIEHQLLLESKHAEPVRVTARNLSLGGMRIYPCPISLRLGERVFVSFQVPGDVKKTDFRLNAIVVRFNLSGAGLMFEVMENSAIQKLSDALAAFPGNTITVTLNAEVG